MIELDKKYLNVLKNTRFIDLFAGIGGFRYAMESFGATCVFSSEWDKFAQACYANNFGETPSGDITKINKEEIPSHNVLCAGFPCQSFSVSGKRKGFQDTRGTLFFDIARISEFSQPEILILENVKNFKNHDNGRTLDVVMKSLDDIGYDVYYQVLNSSFFGVPQRRERIYFMCFNKKLQINNYSFPTKYDQEKNVLDVLEKNIPDDYYLDRNDIDIYKDPNIKKDLFGKYPARPLQIGKINKGGQGERIYSPFGHAVTQSATTGGSGGSTGLYYVNEKVRKLTPKESSRVQGFPESFVPYERKTQAYKQLGNSVVINVIQMLLKSVIDKNILI